MIKIVGKISATQLSERQRHNSQVSNHIAVRVAPSFASKTATQSDNYQHSGQKDTYTAVQPVRLPHNCLLEIHKAIRGVHYIVSGKPTQPSEK